MIINLLIYLKSWENYKILNIINLLIIINFKKKLLLEYFKNIYISLFLINLIINTKLDFYSRHIFLFNKIKDLLIYKISFLFYIFFENNIKKILLKIKIKNNIIKKINNIIINFNIIVNTNYFFIYTMINNNIYKNINIINIFINIIYWINLNNLNKFFINKKELLKNFIFIKINIINWIYIFFNKKEIYNNYSICGKLDNTNILLNQQISSLINWIIKSIFFLNNLIINIKFIKI